MNCQLLFLLVVGKGLFTRVFTGQPRVTVVQSSTYTYTIHVYRTTVDRATPGDFERVGSVTPCDIAPWHAIQTLLTLRGRMLPKRGLAAIYSKWPHRQYGLWKRKRNP